VNLRAVGTDHPEFLAETRVGRDRVRVPSLQTLGVFRMDVLEEESGRGLPAVINAQKIEHLRRPDGHSGP